MRRSRVDGLTSACMTVFFGALALALAAFGLACAQSPKADVGRDAAPAGRAAPGEPASMPTTAATRPVRVRGGGGGRSGSVMSRPAYESGPCAATAPATGRTYVVSQKHPRASDDNPGTDARPLRTISAAARLAQPGDKVLVHEGVYRERVSPARGGEEARPIVYQAVAGQRVLVKGSELWRPKWKPLAGQEGVFVGRLDDGGPDFGNYNPYLRIVRGGRQARPTTEPAMPLTCGQVFADGLPLTEVETLDALATPGTWTVSPDGQAIYVHFPRCQAGPDAPPGYPARRPEDWQVEISVRPRIFGPEQRGLGHIHVRGFVFEHAANNHPTPQVGAVSTRSGHHWVIENCVIRYAKTVGLDVGSEWGIEKTDERGPLPPGVVVGHHLVRHNVVSDNGLCGMLGLVHRGTQVIGNVVERNNFLGMRTWEMGAIKFHMFYDGLIEGNLIRDNDCFGIWLDNRYKNSRVTRNVVLNNYLAGVNVELGSGPVLVDNNIIGFTRDGDGIYSHDASGVIAVHNLIYGNSNFGLWLCVATDRGRTTSSNHRVYNNMILANKTGAISLPFPFDRAQDNFSDCNLIMGGGETMDEASGPWPPLFMLNTSHKHVKMPVIAEAFAAALDAAAAAPQDRPNLELWQAQPFLTLQQWRMLGGHDLNSRTVKLYHEILRTRTPEFEIKLDGTLWGIQCQAVENVERDFFGNPLPSDNPLPGPFQNLQPGNNRLTLWPVREVAPPATRPAGRPSTQPAAPAAEPTTRQRQFIE